MEAWTNWPLSGKILALKLPVSGCLDGRSLVIYHSTSKVCVHVLGEDQADFASFHCERLSDSPYHFVFLRQGSIPSVGQTSSELTYPDDPMFRFSWIFKQEPYTTSQKDMLKKYYVSLWWICPTCVIALYLEVSLFPLIINFGAPCSMVPSVLNGSPSVFMCCIYLIVEGICCL